MYNYFINPKNAYKTAYEAAYEEGVKEGRKIIAKKLLLDGSYDIYKISEITNLSVEELQKLQKKK